MAISFDKALGVHPQGMIVRAERAEVIASNIANADTPGYKARDIDFASAMSKAKTDSLQLVGTSNLHMNGGGKLSTAASADLNYRIPMQPTLDGNTVETDVEQAQFAENALYYRASLAFLDSSIRSLKFAIKGGD